jgi:hypothetical protein
MIVDVLVNPYVFALGGELLVAWPPGPAALTVVIVSAIRAERLIAVIAALLLGPATRHRSAAGVWETLKAPGPASQFFWVKSRIARDVVSGIRLAFVQRRQETNSPTA